MPDLACSIPSRIDNPRKIMALSTALRLNMTGSFQNPDQAWQELAPYFLNESSEYASWG